MSLIVSVALEDFAVIVSDGLVVKVEQGMIVPVASNICKFRVVGDGQIAVASTGSLVMNRMIAKFAARLAEQTNRPDRPPGLFSILAREIPDEIQRLSKLHPTDMDIEYVDGTEKLNLGGTNLLICGYDASQEKIRSIYWSDQCKDACCRGKVGLVPHRGMGYTLTPGYPKAGNLILEKFDHSCLLRGPLAVCKEIENLVQQAAAAFPKLVGGKISSHIMTPEPRTMDKMEVKNESEAPVAN